jgi:hypothetical protein
VRLVNILDLRLHHALHAMWAHLMPQPARPFARRVQRVGLPRVLDRQRASRVRQIPTSLRPANPRVCLVRVPALLQQLAPKSF